MYQVVVARSTSPFLQQRQNWLTSRSSRKPASGDGSPSASIRLEYETGGQVTPAHADTDDQGRFVAQFEVPRTSHPGSVNTVTVQFFDGAGGTMALQTSHTVKQAEIFLAPNAGPPGIVETLPVEGFRELTLPRSVLIGDMDVHSGSNVATDAQGAFVSQFVVPGVNNGCNRSAPSWTAHWRLPHSVSPNPT